MSDLHSDIRYLSIIQTRREFLVSIVCECPSTPDRSFDFVAYNAADCDSRLSGHGETRTQAMESYLDAIENLS